MLTSYCVPFPSLMVLTKPVLCVGIEIRVEMASRSCDRRQELARVLGVLNPSNTKSPNGTQNHSSTPIKTSQSFIILPLTTSMSPKKSSKKSDLPKNTKISFVALTKVLVHSKLVTSSYLVSSVAPVPAAVAGHLTEFNHLGSKNSTRISAASTAHLSLS